MLEDVFIFPLSSAQQRIWFLDQLEPNSASYNIPAAVRLKGALNVVALEQSLNEVVRRHEALRTRFEALDGQAKQVIVPPRPVPLVLHDLREVAEPFRDAEASKLATSEASQPFDLTSAPLLRATLLQLGENEHILTLIMHHIVSDGWSMSVLVREIVLLYDAFINGKPSPLSELPVQYADFAHWEQNWLQGNAVEEHVRYWEQKLAGPLPLLELPTDYPRPRFPAYRGAQQLFRLPQKLTEALKVLARSEGATLFMVLLAAFKALLYRYTELEDIIVGVPNANRSRAETEALIGIFVNTLALRTDLSGKPSFRQLLGRVRETVLEADAHRELPFEKVVERLQPERSLSHNPLFQVMFIFQSVELPPLELTNLTVELLSIDSGTTKFDLTLSMRETQASLTGSLQYDSDLFDSETASRLCRHLQNLLEGIVSDPDCPIARLPLLSTEEEEMLLVRWNETTSRAAESNCCLGELFDHQVERSPEAVAVVGADGLLTYQELQGRANQVAHFLQNLGVGREIAVGIMMDRSVETIVTLLAVLKAGGAYLPLDPLYPPSRLAFMLADSQAPLVLTQRHLREQLIREVAPLLTREGQRTAMGVEVVVLETELTSMQPLNNPVSTVASENIAYAIYTSGSTGRPKGIAIEHRSAVAMLQWAHSCFAPEHLAGVLASTSLCFDLSIFELFVPLTMGGKVIIADNALQLPTLPEANQVTLINTVPSAMAELLRTRGVPESVQVVNLAGEALPQSLVQQVYAQTNAVQVWNLYGPSEDTTYSTGALIQRDSRRSPPIGRPISNSQAYILDREMQPVPVGIAGELWLGGAGLARGYVNGPEATAERFLPDPFSGRAGARVYRTGDLARYLAEGEIEYLGRLDHQIKLRGFRIELGEIEAVLREQGLVKDCVVIAAERSMAVEGNGGRSKESGERELVAYVVLMEGAAAELGPEESLRQIKRQVEDKLPGYMVPVGWMALAELPLTANGKLDRQRLPSWLGAAAGEGRRASTAVEEVLAGIWSEVLGVEDVGVDQNFFAVGGHSLLATRVMSRVRDAFHVDLPLRRMFEVPTIAELATSIEAARNNGRGFQLPSLKRVGGCEAPLSFAQQRLWFLDWLEPGNPFYILSTAVRIKGPLDVVALERTLNEIVRRHELLRTTFVSVDGQPQQVIAPAWSVDLPVIDLRRLTEDERELEVQRLVDEEAQLPFDFSHGPPLRASLLRLSAAEHVALFTMHHIISDGWSKGVLVNELAALYPAFSLGQPAPLRELPIQYADFAIWQRESLQGEALESELAYWRQQLAQAPTVLALPTDKPRPAVQSYRGATQSFVLSRELSKGLKDLSRHEGVTLFMTLLAAFSALLSRYTGQEDLIVGTAIANRGQAEIENLIGMFVNTLAMRVNTSGNPTFRIFLEQVKEVSLEAYAHQTLPFEKLIDELQLKRDTSRSPLVQAMVILQNTPMDQLELPGLTLSIIESETRVSKLDLILSVVEEEGTLRGSLEYNTDLFEPATIVRMAGHLQTLLEGIIAEPECRLSELPLLTAAEQRQLEVWNDTDIEYETGKCIHELFEAQALSSPDAPAVTYHAASLTYAELNQKSNQLAHYLKRLGVGPEVRVGIFLERSMEMLIGLLGVLKAGAAYVPMDADYPRERLSFMIEDAEVAVLLTKASWRTNLPQVRSHLVCLDTDWAAINLESMEGVKSEVGPDNLAYVIYTSGSTGRPKGVMVSHRNVVNLFAAIYPKIGFREREVWTLFHSFAFDFSVWELCGALLHGGHLVIVPPWTDWTPETFYDLLKRHQVTILNQTPSIFSQLTLAGRDMEQLAADLALRQIIIGGEALPPELALELRKGSIPVWNFYGPTEATVWTAIHRIGSTEAGDALGQPIPNMQIYVLDRFQQMVPVSVAGELHISGAGLARGYWGDPELTAEKFVPHPYSDLPGARLYRTGDLSRYLPNGNVEFLGRIDEQVKVRGYRIELGEIESVLCEHSSVSQAVVLAYEKDTGARYLVAYLVADKAQPLAVEEVRRFLRERLPAYMIPAAFVSLDALPLTPNGKIDRQALPIPDGERPDLEKDYVAPRTPTEEILVALWVQVLDLKKVGIHDDFFEIGGHSLLATQVISRVREVFQLELPLRSLFESPTVAELALVIDQTRSESLPADCSPITPASRDGELPLSFAQQRLWFLDQLVPNSASYNLPLAVRLTGQLNLPALEQSLSEIVQRHEVLRTTFPAVGGQPFQMISPLSSVNLHLIDLTELTAAEQQRETDRLAGIEAWQPFYLASGPLLRASLLRLADTDHVLFLTMHHIVSDGWSMSILVREVAALYEALSSGQASPLPPLPIQYADFVLWQSERLQGPLMDQQLSYWREQLADAPALLELPTDHPRPAVQSYHGRTESFLLSEELSQSLSDMAQREGVTLFMMLLAAFDVLLWRYTGAEDLMVGTPIANRNRGETEGLIGFFVNTLVLRVRVSGKESFHELLRQVREVCLGAYGHQDLAFEKLVGELQPERNLSHSPLFQVMFTLQNGAVELPTLTNLKISPLFMENSIGKFDLTLLMTATEQGLMGAMEYRTDLFERATIQRMIRHFQTLLEAIVAQPRQRLSESPILTPDEQQQLRDWNQTAAIYPQDTSLPQLLEQQVERTPHTVAVVFEEEKLTYRELNARSNQLAHYLRGLGVGPGVLVGVLMERSLEVVVSLLGILKAGGAYVPLDPEYPHERLSFMQSDAQLQIVLTDQRSASKLAEEGGARLLCLDADWQTITQESEENPFGLNTSESAAYAIYTSGSTGKPKGVVIEHRSLTNIIFNSGKKFECTPDDVMPCIASFAFDISLFELFTPLLSGATCVLLDREHVLDLPRLAGALERVTLLHTVPSLMRQLVHFISENGLSHNYSRLKRIFIGGDLVPPNLLGEMREIFPGAAIEVLYGPTEAAIICTSYRVPKEGRIERHIIGKPLSNAAICICDKDRNLVPVGVRGEIYVGGVGVARGYLKREKLTRERFVTLQGQRYYRTGDLGRYLPDGNIEFAGRIDQQVKLRGFRIELGEIESALRQHPQVHDCLVLLQEDAAGEKRLVAYLVKAEPKAEAIPGLQQGLNIGELRQYLKEKLPDYMVPAAFVGLDRIPVMPNGKIDRRALPWPEPDSRETHENYIAPATMVEEIVSDIWQDVLQVKRIGRRDNFFDLGGHSLLATQVISRLREALSRDLPVRLLFEHPTIENLSACLEAEQRVDQQLPLPPIAPVSRDRKLELSFAQQRLWLLHQLEPNSHAFNIPLAVRLAGQLNIAALEQTLSEVVRRHETLRTRFDTVKGQGVQVIIPATAIKIPLMDLSALPQAVQETEMRALAQVEVRNPFDLRRGPVWRVVLVKMSESEHVLLLTMHHIVSDAWSIGVLVRELVTYYQSFSTACPSEPPEELRIQYADFAAWQRHWLRGEVLDQQLAYWKGQLGNPLPTLRLPTDFPPSRLPTFRGAAHFFTPPDELAQELKALSRRQNVTLFMTLLAAFKVLLHHFTGQSDIMLGANIAGRTRPEVENLIGFFVNLLMLRTDLSGDPTFGELLARVREVALGAYAHQDVPFERLVEEFKVERDHQHKPLQVAFTFDNTPRETVQMPNLSLTLLEFELETTRLDLVLALSDGPQGLRGSFQYNIDLFYGSTIARLAGRYELLLQLIVEAPDARLSELLQALREPDHRQQDRKQKEFREARARRLQSAKLKRIPQSSMEVV